MSNDVHAIKPLGVFGFAWPIDKEPVRRVLLPLVGMLPEAQRSSIGAYLRAGAITFAAMEYTTDVLGAFPNPRRDKLLAGAHILEVFGGAFAVPGGSGVLTDGTYYWRRDTADYVEHYGVGLPEEFLRHGRSLGWVARPMSQEDILAADQYVMEHIRRLPLDAEEG